VQKVQPGAPARAAPRGRRRLARLPSGYRARVTSDPQASTQQASAALRGIADGTGPSAYLRLTTRPLDQAPFEVARSWLGAEKLRRAVLAGAYRLLDADGGTSGAAPSRTSPSAHVVDVTSLDRLYAGWRGSLRDALRGARDPRATGDYLRSVFPAGVPVVTVHDAAWHAMAWIGSALGVPCVLLGVDSFGQSGTVADLYELHDLVPGAIVNAALALAGQ
jgi:pyruvate dehydrogenase E1 component